MLLWTGLQATWTRLGVLGGVFQVSWRRLAASWSLLRASWRRLWWSSSRLRHVLKFFIGFSSELEAPWRRPGGFLELPWPLFWSLENVLDAISHWASILKMFEASLGGELYWFWKWKRNEVNQHLDVSWSEVANAECQKIKEKQKVFADFSSARVR